MNLILDIGNTRTKVALFKDNELVELKIFEGLQVCDLELILRQNSEVNNCIISCTGKADNDLTNFISTVFEKYIFLSGNTPVPFNNNYETRSTQGPDRISAIAGAHFTFTGSNVLVIDAGTAIKFDFIDVHGNYNGGNISPGLESRFKALHTFTEKLPLLSQSENFRMLGNNTSEAIISGVQNGIIFEIEGYILRLQNEYPSLKTIITGGNAEFFANKLKSTIFVDSNLVLKGLNRILEYNAG